MTISRSKLTVLILAVLAGGLLLGWFFSDSESSHQEHEVVGETIWTCSMHLQIRQNEPGQCPICGMDLIPAGDETENNATEVAVNMSPIAMQLANVETIIVGQQQAIKQITLNGKITADERAVYSQTSHIPGRIEELRVNFTGDLLRRGQIVAEIYSPDLVTAQEELLEARKMKDIQPGLFEAAKTKLRNWKISTELIEQVLKTGKPLQSFPVTADRSGYVIEKRVNTGDHVKQGEAIFEIADLSKVWVLFDIYESEIPWINEGDTVEITIPSIPGRSFIATIDFIDPVIHATTHVATARLELPNKENRLKPEMYVTGKVSAILDGQTNEVVVPKEAILWTGKRSVVYVREETPGVVRFIMREVMLGPALGDRYIIESGLKKGEEIAVNGTFSIDASAQLGGKPSMMNQRPVQDDSIKKE